MAVSASRAAKIQITADADGMAPGIAEARRSLALFQRDAEKMQIKPPKSGGLTNWNADIRQGLSSFNQSAGAAITNKVANSVTEAVTDAAHETLAFERNLTRFQIAARQTPSAMNEMRASVDEVAAATGLARGEVLTGAQAFVDLAGASNYSKDTMAAIARTAQATGSDIGSIATAAYTLTNTMKVSGPELEAVFSGMVNQSKDGAAHFKDMAPELIALMPQFARFGVTGREGAVEISAMFQVMRSGFKDSAETATGMSSIFRGLVLHAKNFEKAGVQIYDVGKDGTKHLRPIAEIFEEIDKSKLMKDPTLLAKAFGRGTAGQGFSVLHDQLELFKKLEEAGSNTTAVKDDLGTYMTSAAGRVDVAWNKVKLTITDAFSPGRVEKFASAAEKAAGFIEHMAELMSGHSDKEHADVAAGDSLQRANRGKKEEGEEIARAQRIVAAKDITDLSSDDMLHAVAYGGMDKGFANMQAGEREFLHSEGRDKQAKGPGTLDAGVARILAAAIGDEIKRSNDKMVAALAAAVKANLVVKVGADPVASAAANAPSVRTGSKGR